MSSQYSNGHRIVECVEFLKTRRVRDELPVHGMRALAVFAGDGASEVRHIVENFKYTSCWDISKELREKFLWHNTVGRYGYTTCDSFAMIRESVEHGSTWQHVFIDHTIGIYGDMGQYCEYFEMFPLAIPAVDPAGGCITISVTEQPYDYEGTGAWHGRRQGYYFPQNPADLQPEALLMLHESIINDCGYTMEDYQVVPRLRKDWGDRMTYSFWTFYIKKVNEDEEL